MLSRVEDFVLVEVVSNVVVDDVFAQLAQNTGERHRSVVFRKAFESFFKDWSDPCRFPYVRDLAGLVCELEEAGDSRR